MTTLPNEAMAESAGANTSSAVLPEAALRQSEARFVTIFRRSPYPIAILSFADGRYVDVNPIWERDTGYTHAEVIGRTPVELGLQSEPPLQLHKRLQEEGALRDIEIQVRMRNGQRHTALMSAELIQLNDEPHILLVFTNITERKRAEERLSFLAEASSVLSRSLDYNLTLQNVAHAAVPGVADWCTIDLLGEDGTLQDLVIAHVDPAKVHWAEELRRLYPIDMNVPVGAPQVIRTGQSQFYPEISDAMLEAVAKNEEELQLLRSVGYKSLMIVPLQTHGRILGAISFVASESERHFTQDDLTMAEELARRAAAAIGNAQLHRAVQQREQELRASEERLRLATEAGKIGIYDHYLLTNQTTYSDMYRAITGVQPGEEITREAWLTRVHPDDRALVAEKLARAVAYGEAYDYEYRICRPDGEWRWLSVSSRISLDEAGRPARLTGALHDVTERKQAEEVIQQLNRDLKRRLDELQSLLDVAPIGIFVAHDPACEVITSNAVGARMLGIQTDVNASKSGTAADELPFRVLQNGRELRPEELPMQYAVTHDVAVNSLEVDLVRSDGSVINLYEYALPLHDEDGKVRGCLGVFVDISARKAAETALHELTATLEQRVIERTAELERSNQELDQFAYVASHDLKAPLRAMINLANWIDEDANGLLPAQSMEYLQKLRGRALRMNRLLDDLLTYSRIGRHDGLIEPVKTKELIQDVVDLLSPPSGFTVSITGEMSVLLTARTPLELVFRNLINNAIKHHHQPAQGVVEISAQDLGDFVEFAVRDNGPGIDPQYHEQIFGMFQTLRPRDEVEGSGMGLAIVKRAIEYRGGTIQVESARGAGTTFCFTWPKKAAKVGVYNV